MNLGILGPPTEGLAEIPEHDTEETPQGDERHVGHDRRDEAGLDGPRCDELGEAVTPNILVDGDGDEDAAGNGFVGVDGVGGGDGGQGSDLDTSAGVAEPDDEAVVPGVLVTESDDEVAEDHDGDVGDHGEETHFGLADAAVATGEPGGDEIAEGAGGEEADHHAEEDGEVEETDLGGGEVVGGYGEDLVLG